MKNINYNKLSLEYLKPFKQNIRKLTNHSAFKSHNHLEKNINLANKKALFYNIKNFCENRNINPFDYIPVTFHIKNGVKD